MSDTGGTAGRGNRGGTDVMGGTAGRAVSADTAVRDGTAESPALTCDVRTIALTMDSLAHACALGGVYLNDIIMAACIEYSRGKLSQSGRQDQVLEVTARIRALDAALCRLINLAALLSSTVCASECWSDLKRSAAAAAANQHAPASTGRYSAAYSGSRAPHADHSATHAGRPARHQHPAARSGKSLALCRYQTKTISGQPHLRSLSDRQPSPDSGWAYYSVRASGPYLTGDSSGAMSALSAAAGESGAAVHIAAVRAADTPAADAADGALSVTGEPAIRPVSVQGRACASSRAGPVATLECSAPVRSGQSKAGPEQTAGRTAAAPPSARHASSGALSVASKDQDAAAGHDSCDRAWSELAAVLAHYACVLFKEASDLGSQLPQWWQTVKWDFSCGCELAQQLKQQLYRPCTDHQRRQSALPDALEQAAAVQTSASVPASAAAEKMAEKSGAAPAAASADAMETVSTHTLTDRATVRSCMDSILSAHRLLCLRPLPYWLTQCFPRMERWVRSIKGSEPSRSDLIFARKLKQICPAGTYLMGYDPDSPLS
ncbi:hypothetical protein [Anaerobiospirillum sp. NML120449]|uniref:hypothetical protein n=1 Tax=Anaerobiospirillum sp. NML120449 TaxID=2932817 RepID=UPI001FF416F5|nr:hypothetical protein [Anaerobiospirillum sp. NML120449]MCK0525805.1 hypothetical protein [Anaerobiospirillum sp. NML120449]